MCHQCYPKHFELNAILPWHSSLLYILNQTNWKQSPSPLFSSADWLREEFLVRWLPIDQAMMISFKNQRFKRSVFDLLPLESWKSRFIVGGRKKERVVFGCWHSVNACILDYFWIQIHFSQSEAWQVSFRYGRLWRTLLLL